MSGPGRSPWRSPPVSLGLVAGLGGLVMVGALGAVIGFLGGVAAHRRTREVLLAAAVALCLTAALIIFERPLGEAEIFAFPNDHPLAEVAGATAAVLALAGLAGTLARRGREPSPIAAEKPVPTRPVAVAPILAASLLGAATLLLVGDQRWSTVALAAVAITAVALGAIVALPRARRLRGDSPQ
jgi:hypothetical protein